MALSKLFTDRKIAIALPTSRMRLSKLFETVQKALTERVPSNIMIFIHGKRIINRLHEQIAHSLKCKECILIIVRKPDESG